MINAKEMIKRSLNKYIKTITVNYSLKGDKESDFQILNILDQVDTEIASKSYSLFYSRLNHDDLIPDNWVKVFKDIIKIQEHRHTSVTPLHYTKLSIGYRNLAKIKPQNP
jgi:hypothetical protein